MGSIVALLALTTFAVPIEARENLTWDANGSKGGTGGAERWDTSSPTWASGGKSKPWKNSALDDATFSGTSGTVTLGLPISAHSLNFTADGYTLIGSTLTLGGKTPTISTNPGVTAIIDATLDGSSGFIKSGTGTLALTGDNTRLSGATIVTAGTLQIDNANALGSSSAASDLILDKGASFQFNADIAHNYTLMGDLVSVAGGANTWSGSPTLVDSTILHLAGSQGTLSGDLADTGTNVLSVVRDGPDRMILSGNNTFTGATTITQGVLQLDGKDALSRGSNLTFSGAVERGGSIELTSAYGDFTRDLGTRDGQVQWLGDGGFLSSDSAGIVNIGSKGDELIWGTGEFVPSGNQLILGTSNNNTLDFQNGIDLSGEIRTIQVEGGNNDGHASISGVMAGKGGLNLVSPNSGVLELTGRNTYTGGTVITSGTLVVGSDANFGDASGMLTFNGGALRNADAFTTERSVALDAGGGVFHADANLDLSGPIDGVGSLTKTGLGSLTLTNANSYTGGTTISTGALQIGDGGISGSIEGNIANNGLLAFDRSDDAIFSGAIGGTGGLEQRGAGTLTLTGENTYTGGTTISAGTLQVGNGVATGSIVGNVNDNGLLAFNRSDETIFGGTIGGTGSLEQRGAGTLTLTGENTYAGSTTISAGTLQIGNAGATGSLAGNIADNGLLAFNRSNNVSYGGVISGVGAVSQNGAGTLTLTNANSYTGGTTISAGALQIGDGGTSGSIEGNIANNGLLAFNRSDNVSYGGVIAGTGALDKEGAGALMLSGDSSGFLGNTSVNAGTLAVNGALGGTLALNSDARLQGTGTVGTSIAAGTIAPGNSIGTIQVNGNYTQLAGSRYEVEIDSSSASDRIAVTGQANILGGDVAVSPAAGIYALGTRYTILTANGGRTGQFDSLSQSLLFVNLGLAYDPNNVYLDVLGRNALSFCDAAATRNQCAAGQGAESLGSNNPVYGAIAGLPSRETAQRAFNSLSGEIHASVKSVMMEDSRFVREAVSDRVREAFGPVGGHASLASGQTVLGTPGTGRAFWTRTFGSFGHRNTDGNAAQINRSVGGFFFGGDTLIADRLLLGMAAGYSNSSFNVNERVSASSSDNYHLSGYGGTQWGALGLRFGAAHTWHVLQTNRSIAFSGFSDHANGNYTAGTVQVFGELGYALPLRSISLEPFVRAAYVNFNARDFNERGGAAILHSASNNAGVTYTTVGLNAAKTFSHSGRLTTTARGMIGWRHALGNLTPLSTFAFDGGSSFAVAGLPIVGDAMVLAAGLDAHITKAATLGIYYSGQVLNNILDNGVRANFHWRF